MTEDTYDTYLTWIHLSLKTKRKSRCTQENVIDFIKFEFELENFSFLVTSTHKRASSFRVDIYMIAFNLNLCRQCNNQGETLENYYFTFFVYIQFWIEDKQRDGIGSETIESDRIELNWKGRKC